MTKLAPGDRVRFRLTPEGRRLDGVVADFLPLYTRGDRLIPVVRPQSRKRPASERAKPIVIRWLPRKSLRKLPS